MKKIFIILSTIFFIYSCDVAKQISGAYNLSQCTYDYNSINNIKVAGVNLGKGKSLSIADIASLSTILSGGNLQTIPFSMTLNLNVKNPNQTAAYLNGLEYLIELNDMEFSTGSLDVPLHINPGEEALLPLSIGLDLKNLINRYSQDRVTSEMSRFLGISPGQTKVSVKLWPKMLIGNTPIKSPAHIPITFLFGGK
ncbi:MAG: LEA type 2 family protein [Dysgonamonadaceae bacterium]|nr:LEA type 2 family protein [Dysgonamonadaceae bacterium]MDD4727459.1 LEA type 2 family protein [Dysgonamonadaceae bacterium]